jgi:hypothetical protein
MSYIGTLVKHCDNVKSSNGNASEAKANEGFDNSIFFASEAKRTCSLEGNLLAKRSEHVRKK